MHLGLLPCIHFLPRTCHTPRILFGTSFKFVRNCAQNVWHGALSQYTIDAELLPCTLSYLPFIIRYVLPLRSAHLASRYRFIREFNDSKVTLRGPRVKFCRQEKDFVRACCESWTFETCKREREEKVKSKVVVRDCVMWVGGGEGEQRVVRKLKFI